MVPLSSYFSSRKCSQKQSDDDFSRLMSQIESLNEKSPAGKNANSSTRNKRVKRENAGYLYARQKPHTRNTAARETNEWNTRRDLEKCNAHRNSVCFPGCVGYVSVSKFSFRKMIQWFRWFPTSGISVLWSWHDTHTHTHTTAERIGERECIINLTVHRLHRIFDFWDIIATERERERERGREFRIWMEFIAGVISRDGLKFRDNGELIRLMDRRDSLK